jgi:AcrR family transcriptional regulator
VVALLGVVWVLIGLPAGGVGGAVMSASPRPVQRRRAVRVVVARPGARSHGVARSSAREHTARMQRARLLSAAVLTVDEVGWPDVTVAQIAGRARVSRRTFYDLFADREDCLLAMLDDAVARIEGELATTNAQGSWRVRVREGLWTILAFFDREPVLARVCVVEALRGGPLVLERREEIFARLAHVLDQGRGESPRAQASGLTAEGLVGAAFTIVHARLLRTDEGECLTGLAGELMSMIVLPYLGPAVARREQNRTGPAPASSRNGRPGPAEDRDPLRDVPMRLTYRTALVLDSVAQNPGASNRRIGEQADLYDQGQVSKLLARLERLGLLQNTGNGHTKGEPNAWHLTDLGERVTQQLSLSTPSEPKHEGTILSSSDRGASGPSVPQEEIVR